jgi:RND family efflux transporter MFP subunit
VTIGHWRPGLLVWRPMGVVLTGLALIVAGPAADARAALKVRVIRVSPDRAVAERRWVGSVAAAREHVVASPSAGVLRQCPWQPGQTVRKGQIIVQVQGYDLLDELALAPYQLARLQAEVKQAVADYELLKLGPRPERVAALDEQAKLTRDSLKDTRRQMAIIERRLEIEQRFGDARRRLSPLEDQYDRVINAHAALLIQVSRIDSERALLRLKARQQELDKAAAVVEAKKAQLALTTQQQKQIQARVARNSITATRDALVLEVKRRQGELARKDEELLRLMPVDGLEVVIEMSEEEYMKLAPELADRFFRATAAAGGKVMNCRWVRTAPTADERTRVIKVYLALDAPSPYLRAGMSLRVELLAAAKQAGLLLPASCVVRAADRVHVWVVRQGVAVARNVLVRPHSKRLVRVVKGLAPGDQVVVDPPAGLKSMSAVQVSPAGEN